MIRMILALVLGVGIFSVVAWRLEVGPFNRDVTPGITNPGNTPPVKLGEFLYTPAPYPEGKAAPLTRRADPILVSAILAPVEKIELSPKVDGQLLMIGDPIAEGALQAAGVAAFLCEPFYSVEIPVSDRKIVKVYERFYEGSKLSTKQLLSLVDPAKSLSDVEQKKARVDVAIADKDAAKALAEEYKKRYEREVYLFN